MLDPSAYVKCHLAPKVCRLAEFCNLRLSLDFTAYSCRGGYTGDYTGEYYRGYQEGY